MAAKFILLSFLIVKLLIFSDAESVGVCYGRMGDNLPSQQDVIDLYKKNGITKMRLYEPYQDTLQALGGTNIQLILDVPNTDLESVASGAKNWVQNNILSYPSVNFRYISVGNEVDPNNESRRYARFVLPAMRNVQKVLQDAGLNQIKVSTSTYTGLLKTSWPPSNATFHDNVIDFIKPIISFLVENNSPMLVNILPYFAYIESNPKIKLSYALFTNPGVEFTDNGRDYYNLFDAMHDAHYVAMAPYSGNKAPPEIKGGESGWSSRRRPLPDATRTPDATRRNAETYYKNLIAHVKSGKGTPLKPGRYIETYLFAMFDENQKPGDESEKHFGLFYPNGVPKYNLTF